MASENDTILRKVYINKIMQRPNFKNKPNIRDKSLTDPHKINP